MGTTKLVDKVKYSLIQPHYSNVGIEFNSDCLRLAAVDASAGKIQVTHLDSEPLARGVIDINPFKPNILNFESLTSSLKNLWSRNTAKDSDVCLLLQDRAALTFNLVLESAAASHQEFQDLIRFKLKKNVPFRIEESHISYFNPAGISDDSATNLWVTVMHGQVLQQYEKFLRSAIDVECGLVDLATLNEMNLAHQQIKAANLQQNDLLYVNLNLDYVSIAITQKGKLTFYRTRALEKQNGIVQEALAEIHPTTMYYLDKLGGQNLGAVFIYSIDHSDELAAQIQQELGMNASVLNIDAFTGTRFDSSNSMAYRNFVPLVGLLVSRKVEFA